MARSAQGLSLNAIIIAAIALIVLIVLVVIFSGRVGVFGKSVKGTTDTYENKCELPGTQRQCESGQQCGPGGTHVQGAFDDCNGGWCCNY